MVPAMAASLSTMVQVTDKRTGLGSKEPVPAGRWLERVTAGRSPEEAALIRRACAFAHRVHAGQRRLSGEPYVEHALAVAGIVAGLNLDGEAVAAALLHDAVEDTDCTLEEIRERFGPAVARLVDGVTKMEAIRTLREGAESRQEQRRLESLRKMLLAMVDDVRVVLIKLADRLHNMRTLAALPEDRRRRIARETLEVYAPLANRLGIWQLKWELEDLAFRHLEPETYRQIAAWLAERREDRERYIARFIRRLEQELARAGIRAQVTGRPKHIYSIWRKMQRKRVDYQQIHDVRAVRILVDEVKDCYAALGVVHGLWQYIPGEFDDYIATPKENSYQSIHTAVIGPEGKTVEVQIRTHAMHRQAELGVAAHWRYKEGGEQDPDFERRIALLRQLLEWKEDLAQARELDFGRDLFGDRVYVFTPRGDVIDLPQGATPLDFAYRIHTELGHRCRGAKVNGKMVPLTYRLRTGEQVEILAVKRGGPSRDWLNPHLGYLATSRARSKVQQWFRQQDHESNVAAGRSLLERELARLGLGGVAHEELARRLGYEGRTEEFLAALGRGDLRPTQVVQAVQGLQQEHRSPPEALLAPGRGGESKGTNRTGGGDSLLTQLAGCCRPVAGDAVVGYITRGRGITVHRRDCPHALRYASECPQRLIELDWDTVAGREGATYPVDVRIRAFDRAGLLRDVAAVLANEHINVAAVRTQPSRRDHLVIMELTLEIADLEQLSRVLAKIGQLPNVQEVRREVH